MKDNTKNKTYFVTGGGTGGHIYPAVAVGWALQKEPDTKKVFYVGNPNNLEKKIAEDKVFDFLGVNKQTYQDSYCAAVTCKAAFPYF